MPDFSKLGQMPDSYKEEILRKSKEMMEGSGVTSVERHGLHSDTAKHKLSEAMTDKIVEQAGADNDEATKEESAAIKAYKKNLEQECDEEARRDEKMIQQTLDEALKDIMSDDENL